MTFSLKIFFLISIRFHLFRSRLSILTSHRHRMFYSCTKKNCENNSKENFLVIEFLFHWTWKLKVWRLLKWENWIEKIFAQKNFDGKEEKIFYFIPWGFLRCVFKTISTVVSQFGQFNLHSHPHSALSTLIIIIDMNSCAIKTLNMQEENSEEEKLFMISSEKAQQPQTGLSSFIFISRANKRGKFQVPRLRDHQMCK